MHSMLPASPASDPLLIITVHDGHTDKTRLVIERGDAETDGMLLALQVDGM